VRARGNGGRDAKDECAKAVPTMEGARIRP
jgi:hypothetical protein